MFDIFFRLYFSYIFIFILFLFIDFLLIKQVGSRINKNDINILTIYECGFLSFNNIFSLYKFNKKYFLKYYIVCILYLIFDIELIYLYPLIILLSNSIYFFNLDLFVLFLLLLLLITILVEIYASK